MFPLKERIQIKKIKTKWDLAWAILKCSRVSTSNQPAFNCLHVKFHPTLAKLYFFALAAVLQNGPLITFIMTFIHDTLFIWLGDAEQRQHWAPRQLTLMRLSRHQQPVRQRLKETKRRRRRQQHCSALINKDAHFAFSPSITRSLCPSVCHCLPPPPLPPTPPFCCRSPIDMVILLSTTNSRLCLLKQQ